MMYLGDFPADQAIYFMWNTNDSSGGSITRAADGTLSVYKDNSDGTSFDQTQVTTGITNDEDVDGLTGVHSCCITTTNAWYETGHDYVVVLSASTIDGETVNAVIATFSIENRHMVGTDNAALATTALSNAIWTNAKADFLNAAISGRAPSGEYNTQMGYIPSNLGDVPTATELNSAHGAGSWATATGFSTHSAANVWAVGTRALTDKAGFSLSTAGIKAIWDQLTNVLTTAGSIGKLLVENINATISSRSSHSAANVWTVGTRALTDKSGFALSAAGANLILKDSTFALAMADAMWDEILTGATHNIATSAGRRVREIGAYAIQSGTAQAGNSHSITLSATASAVDGTYNRNLIILTDNTGVGQTRTIVDYNGTTKVAVIDRDWRTSPDATTTYQITPDNTPLVVDQGVAQEGTSTTIKLRAYASSTNDIYLCNVVAIIAGTGRGQARLVGAYNGTTKVVTICGDNWITNPDNTSVYVLMPYGTTCASCIGTYALGLIKSENDDALTDIKLDHLIAVADGDDPVNDSIIAQIAASDGDWGGFAKADDSLEAIRDRGDSAWTTATSVTVSDKTGFALSAAGVDAILDENIEGTHTMREMIRLIGAYAAGKSSGGGTATITFRDIDDTKDRIVATVTSVGNRTAVTLTED